MNILDIVIVLFLISCIVMGWKNGVIKETVSFVGIVLVLILSFLFKEPLANFLCKYFPFFSFKGSLKDMVVMNIVLYQGISFFLIFSLLLSIYHFILKISGILQKLVNFTFVLLLPSKILGSIVGLLKGYIIVFILLFLVFVPCKNYAFLQESTLTPKILNESPILSTKTKSMRKLVEDVYMLTEQVTKEEISKNDANLKILDVMLEYKIVSKKTVEQLVVLDKLKGVKGINKIIKK